MKKENLELYTSKGKKKYIKKVENKAIGLTCFLFGAGAIIASPVIVPAIDSVINSMDPSFVTDVIKVTAACVVGAGVASAIIVGTGAVVGSVVAKKLLNHKTKYKNSMSVDAFMLKINNDIENVKGLKARKYRKIMKVANNILENNKEFKDSVKYKELKEVVKKLEKKGRVNKNNLQPA